MIYPELRPLRGLGITLFKAYCHPTFVPYRSDRAILFDKGNVRHIKMQQYYKSLSTDTLRWQVIAAMGAKIVPHAVVRERVRRRCKEAFREALKQCGYDKHGKPLRAEKNGLSIRPLQGTLEVHIYQSAALHEPFHSIIRQATRILKALEQQCQNSQAGTVVDVGQNRRWRSVQS